jgi:hypothetical protein
MRQSWKHPGAVSPGASPPNQWVPCPPSHLHQVWPDNRSTQSSGSSYGSSYNRHGLLVQIISRLQSLKSSVMHEEAVDMTMLLDCKSHVLWLTWAGPCALHTPHLAIMMPQPAWSFFVIMSSRKVLTSTWYSTSFRLGFSSSKDPVIYETSSPSNKLGISIPLIMQQSTIINASISLIKNRKKSSFAEDYSSSVQSTPVKCAYSQKVEHCGQWTCGSLLASK